LRAAVGEKLLNEVATGQIGSDASLQLLAREKDKAGRRLDQYQRCALVQTRALTHVGRHHDTAPISHHDMMRPTHDLSVPSPSVWWHA